MPSNLSDLVRLHGGVAAADDADNVIVHGIATLSDAGPDDLSFFSNAIYRDELISTKACVVVLKKEHASLRSAPSIVVESESPRDYVGRLVDEYGAGRNWPSGTASSASVHQTAHVPSESHIGEFVAIAAGVSIGANTKVLAGAAVAEDCIIGSDCILHEGCVIGAEGFGFYGEAKDRRRFRHQGHVEIGDNVEIGANTCVDRGVLGNTTIGSGTKIDNLVQVGHNVRIGSDCLVCGCVAIGGSAVIGDGVTIGGGTLINNHAKIASGVTLMGGTNVISAIRKEGGVYGSAMPPMSQRALHMMWRRLLKLGRKKKKQGS